jgi:oligosaccharide reducing-end xylanase
LARAAWRSCRDYGQLIRAAALTPICVIAFAPRLLHAADQAAQHRNLFAELLGKSEREISARISSAHHQLFEGNGDSERVYYRVGDGTAYIADTGNGDVRSEGMSYGMMIAVQLDDRATFDQLWRWAKTHMYHASGARQGYFAWQCSFKGEQLDPGLASDGEEWFATALFFASHRWGNREGIFNYEAEAQQLLRALRKGDRGDDITAIFDPQQLQVVFAPTRAAATFTDPSYHLPAFTELWSRWAESPEDRAFWTKVTQTSRTFFHRAVHPKTGLMPEYAHFDGTPYQETNFGQGKADFRFDAWRTLANVALDHAWFSADPWQVDQSNRVLKFLATQGSTFPNQYRLDGTPLSSDSSVGLVAMASVAGLTADRDVARPFVQRLWDAETPTGRWRYYSGLLYLLGLLQTSGRFQIYLPPTHP